MSDKDSPSPQLDPAWPAKRKVTLIGALANLLLTVIKIIAGLLGQSQALVVDGVHSLSDLASDAVVLVAARWGAIDADHNHPYGHRRIETVAVALVGMLLIIVALAFMLDAISRLLQPERLLTPVPILIWVAVASVAVKEGLFWYTRAVARKLRSQLIMANAWHHRSDAFSSVVVIVGLVGVRMGHVWLDAVAALVVAAAVAWMGGRFAFEALSELVDTGVTRGEQKELGRIVRSVEGVRGFRNLRTRLMGGQVVMDVCILLDGRLSLNEADQVARAVRRRLLSESTEVFDAVVSVAPWRDDPKRI